MKVKLFIQKHQNRLLEGVILLLAVAALPVSILCVSKALNILIPDTLTGGFLSWLEPIIYHFPIGMIVFGYLIKHLLSRTTKPGWTYVKAILACHIVTVLCVLIGRIGTEFHKFFIEALILSVYMIGIDIFLAIIAFWHRIEKEIEAKRSHGSEKNTVLGAVVIAVLSVFFLTGFLYPTFLFGTGTIESLQGLIGIYTYYVAVGVLVAGYDSIKKRLPRGRLTMILACSLLLIEGFILYGAYCLDQANIEEHTFAQFTICWQLIFISASFLCIELITFLSERIRQKIAAKACGDIVACTED